ncbi:ATP-binding protein [Variovorax saccharolyticus]|uniref:ATP-binding protein n=1 Tax=Variovorax saccharolyticus TaxID=3053516 RepID=UPI002574B60A|nr:ATP-binding protein [Variovorax sp. J31P216]MDM0025737.1 ATP-binding protein [Variovorax sp. J31P216]
MAESSSKLGDVVKISRQFLRSVRIDADYGREDALAGYICQGTARSLLESMARQVRDTRQRAFTWTGPYGGGKSSLALLLCSLVGPNPKLRARAKAILGQQVESAISSAFDARGDGWLVLPIVGKRAKVSDSLSKALSTVTKGTTDRRRKEKQDVIAELVAASEQHSQGVLVVIDELGKFLESAAQDGDDVYFFQELAEAASRSSGRLVIVGILHQSFDAYAARLSRQSRDDWAKVQGRFVDIPLVAATDEMVELIGRAIEVDASVDRKGAEPSAKTIAHAIRERRPGTPVSIGSSIARCWPLHPVVASLLGPISRRRFSQNERSTFGFLASREPLGFMEFLDGSEVSWASMYGPSRYWDYLRANLDQAILASPDGHRWAVASEAVERAEAKGTPLHIEVTKCVALIEMFRSGSGLVPESNVLGVCVQGAAPQQVQEALSDLVGWKILIERKHLAAFGVFAGSDFDIEAAINQARGEIGTPDLQLISTLADLQPILAKRLYHETGTMRWFSRRIVRLEDVERDLSTGKVEKGSVGAFLLCLPDVGSSLVAARHRIKALSLEPTAVSHVLGIPENADRIGELALELVACERILRTRPELEGDSVARKELIGRTTTVKTALEDELADAFSLSRWFWQGDSLSSAAEPITQLASSVAQAVFECAPHLHSELLNREEPSSNSNKARKDLMYRMVSRSSSPDLGYSGFPADAGLYFSILKETGLHREFKEGQWGFGEPFAAEPHGPFFTLWMRTEKFLLEEGAKTALAALYEFWAAPPYGLRKGIMPVLAMAFFMAHRSSLALYVDGVFTPDLSEALIDEWLLDPKRVTLTYVSASSDQTAYMRAVAASLPQRREPETSTTESKPLDVARALVGLVMGLPNWTRRTNSLSASAQEIRTMLLKANDPNKVLFSDLPTILDARDADDVLIKLRDITEELVAAYPKVLGEVKTTVLKAMDQTDGDAKRLQARAKTVKGIAGEFRLEAFVARLENFDGSDDAIEGLISLASDKPPAQWVDRDIDRALLQLGSWAHDFRRAETLAPLRGRPSTRRAIGVVFGGGFGREATTSFDIDDKDANAVSRLAGRLVADLQNQPRELALAALAEAGALLVNAKDEEAVQ